MARARRGSPVVETARQRLAGLKSIKKPTNFGAGLTIAEYELEINGVAADLESYNQDVAALDDKQNRFEARELGLREFNRRMLAATEAQFGPDSSEFEQAGGKRQSEHKKPVRKPKSGSSTT